MKKMCKYCSEWDRVTGNTIYNFGVCYCNKFVDMSKTLFHHNNISDNICFSDIDDRRIYFRTGEAFGCIHFKKKEI